MLAADVAVIRGSAICFLTPALISRLSVLFSLFHVLGSLVSGRGRGKRWKMRLATAAGGSPGPGLHQRRSRHFSGGARSRGDKQRRQKAEQASLCSRERRTSHRATVTLAPGRNDSRHHADADFMTLLPETGNQSSVFYLRVAPSVKRSHK